MVEDVASLTRSNIFNLVLKTYIVWQVVTSIAVNRYLYADDDDADKMTSQDSQVNGIKLITLIRYY